jgi:hypothetical protein
MRPTLLWGVQGRDPQAVAALRAAPPPPPSFRRAPRLLAPAIPVVTVPPTLGARLTATATRIWRRRLHAYDLLRRMVDIVLAHMVLRVPVFALIGYLIGLSLDGMLDPYTAFLNGKVLFPTSTAAACAATGVALGLSMPFFFTLLAMGSLEIVAIVLIVWSGILAAFGVLQAKIAAALTAAPLL